jgi:uncharacterized protein YpuA (DUF1002 family)
MKRIMVLLTVALVVVALSAPAAMAQERVADENCIFENGKTTCTESVYSDTVFLQKTLLGYGYSPLCGETQILQAYAIDYYYITTTVYKGKSSKVISTQTTEETRGEPYPYGEPQEYCVA